jgi:hypothetical protein
LGQPHILDLFSLHFNNQQLIFVLLLSKLDDWEVEEGLVHFRVGISRVNVQALLRAVYADWPTVTPTVTPTAIATTTQALATPRRRRPNCDVAFTAKLPSWFRALETHQRDAIWKLLQRLAFSPGFFI